MKNDKREKENKKTAVETAYAFLAAAAYNAGPGRIKIWKSSDGLKRDTAQFIENIPFTETRIYVQNVLLYDAIYKKLLSGKGNLLLKPGEKSYKY